MAEEKKKSGSLYAEKPKKPETKAEPKKEASAEKKEDAADEERPKAGGIMPMAEKHAEQRKKLHEKHRNERRDLHGNHKHEHDQMHARHQKEHMDMAQAQEQEMAGAEGGPQGAMPPEGGAAPNEPESQPPTPAGPMA